MVLVNRASESIEFCRFGRSLTSGSGSGSGWVTCWCCAALAGSNVMDLTHYLERASVLLSWVAHAQGRLSCNMVPGSQPVAREIRSSCRAIARHVQPRFLEKLFNPITPPRVCLNLSRTTPGSFVLIQSKLDDSLTFAGFVRWHTSSD